MIREVNVAGRILDSAVPVVFLEDYDMALAAVLCAGADVWVNTPTPPHEASGTSGMKAALNAVPSLSILDGWWLEGHIEGVTGWAVGTDVGAGGGYEVGDAVAFGADARSLYDTLEHTVAPLYYRDPDGFAAVGRDALSLNGSFFTTERMLGEYCRRAYPAGVTARGEG
jgi:starch phosphorylase